MSYVLVYNSNIGLLLCPMYSYIRVISNCCCVVWNLILTVISDCYCVVCNRILTAISDCYCVVCNCILTVISDCYCVVCTHICRSGTNYLLSDVYWYLMSRVTCSVWNFSTDNKLIYSTIDYMNEKKVFPN